ncbi:helix-turn-helix transcriptional regulator [Salmonella enterica subsp. enterica serovar Java]|nr:helix-turn-helix transcriptional regulator [Salmonella enterica subsp. enterica serovar Java]
MMRKPSQIVHCISCDLSCQLFPDSAVRVQYCHNAAFSIWPDGNAFLNLRRFTDLQWADSLADSGMHIVLISDRSLTPLANYWILKSNKIQGIIYSDDDDIVQQQKMHRLFTGRLANSKRGRTLNYTEFILLKRFVSGISIQQIVNIDNIDIKKLYVHKLRLENKLGHSIHKIISNIL